MADLPTVEVGGDRRPDARTRLQRGGGGGGENGGGGTWPVRTFAEEHGAERAARVANTA